MDSRIWRRNKKPHHHKEWGGSMLTDQKSSRSTLGGTIISVTRDTLTQIKGTRPEALFCGRREKRFANGHGWKDIYGRQFCALSGQRWITRSRSVRSHISRGYPGKATCRVRGQHCSSGRLLLAFGSEADGIIRSKESIKKSKVSENKAESNEHSLASQDKWRTMKFDKFSMDNTLLHSNSPGRRT